MSLDGTNLFVRLEQIKEALASLAALVPPTAVYDEDGNDVTDPALTTAYEQVYDALRLAIITSAGPDFSAGISLTGYDPATVGQLALTACLTTTLQVGYTLRWFSS